MKTLLLALALITFSSLYAEVVSPTYLQNLTLAGPNGNIQLAVSANGQAVAVWTNWPNQGAELQAAFFNGISWIYLNNNTGATISFNVSNFFPRFVNGSGTFAIGSAPRVGIDNDGNATIVWVAPNSQIVAARYNKNLLSSVTQLTASGTSNISPTLAVNPEGLAVVVWIRAASYQVQARSFNPTLGVWSDQVIFMRIPAPGTSLVNPIPTKNIPANSSGTYPAGLGLSNTDTGVGKGTMVWIDGPSGTVRAGNFVVPFTTIP